MKLGNILLTMASAMILNSCSQAPEPEMPGVDDRDEVYAFTAVLDNVGSRMGYVEDSESHDLKMVWDEADVIWLYPDESMGDPVERYEFVQNTGAGTSHTVFVHQGYIKNWEHWSGKAIYLFPDGDNLEVEVNSEEFLAKSRVQKSNGDTGHLKYAEHRLDTDGNKHYTGYWASILKDVNLKHDNKLTFDHMHTIVYKVMLRGFIFDVPGGSQLRMSGDAWSEGSVLTLGDKDDPEPFLKVGEYGKDGYEDKVLTAYIIRQVAGDVDGTVSEGSKMKFELFTYDELDGTVMPLDPEDTIRNGNPSYGNNYFTNLPWGEEYTWTVTATTSKQYNAGDYVVADFTDTTKDYAYPKIAVDLGLPLKWAAFNVGAKKIDDDGAYVIWGYNGLRTNGGHDLPKIYNGDWTSGDPERDAASFHWGNEWRTPTYQESLDFVHYTRWFDSNDKQASDGRARWRENLTADDQIYSFETNPARYINDVDMVLVKSMANDKYIYLPVAGNLQASSPAPHATDKAYFCTSDSKIYTDSKTGEISHLPIIIGLLSIKRPLHYYIGFTDNKGGSTVTTEQLAVSVRAVKDKN